MAATVGVHLALAILAVLSLCDGRVQFGPETDTITNLPGVEGNIPFKQYSGYATVNETHGRRLFYWFVESQSSPSEDPVVLWLNGGPGCSSLAGLLTEHGPFRPLADGSVKMNNYSWNKVANVIYLESPSGVGFSYSDTESDYDAPGDSKSANDIVTFLVAFFKAYPQFKANEFYVTGESYGGHYVPTTAQAIVLHNGGSHSDAINLKGIFIGDAWTVPGDDNLGVVQTWLGYNLIRTSTGSDVIKYCNFSNLLPIMAAGRPGVEEAVLYEALTDDQKCQDALQQASTETGLTDPYNIYERRCLSGASSPRVALLTKMAQSEAPLRFHARNLLNGMRQDNVGLDPCTSEYAGNYLNMKSVQEALHAHPTKWSMCNMAINGHYSRKDFLSSMIPVHQFLLKSGLRVVAYSGDIDAIVPTHGTRNWVARLVATGAIAETKSWHQWIDSEQQLGGFLTRYGDQFSFITVHGAGHMVPFSQPLRALDIFRQFLKKEI